MSNAQVATRIKEICKVRGSSISKMLEACSIRKSFIYDLEKRNASPSIEIIGQIADYLDCSVDYLLGRTDNPNISTESYICGDNNGVQAIKNNGAVMINQSSKAEQQDEMTKELIKAFQSMSFTDKMEIMNAVLEKTKK